MYLYVWYVCTLCTTTEVNVVELTRQRVNACPPLLCDATERHWPFARINFAATLNQARLACKHVL